ncbi:acyl-CoA dehydrogenase family protein [Gordonia terrae]|uniref:acyl-CoA dehydrogenase family protein n=1 Tax=Gordonia terrae TaxID=2055 RepID=UPI003F6BA5E9
MTSQAQEFDFSEDLLELRAVVREFCADLSSEEIVRKTMESESGYDRVLWRRLATELGVFGLSVPEELGGDGVGHPAQALVFEELGAALVCGPVIGTLALGIPALVQTAASADGERAAALLRSAIGGETVLTVAAPIADGAYDPDASSLTARPSDDGWIIDGVAEHVPDGMSAEVVLAAARTDTGVSLFAVNVPQEGLERSPLTTMDLTRRQARLEFSGVRGELIADASMTEAACEHAARVGAVFVAAEQVGGAQAMLDRTVAHARERLQFGQPIGAFQAVKHKCADMLMLVEQAKSVAYHGAWSLDGGEEDTRLAASLARAVASEAYYRVTATAIQLHGGTGFTWEYPAHLYFKRAVADSAVLGTPERHYDLVAERALDCPPRSGSDGDTAVELHLGAQ